MLACLYTKLLAVRPLYEALYEALVDGAKALAGYPAGSEVCAVMEAGEPV